MSRISIQAPINSLSYGIVSQNILDNLSCDYRLKPIGPFDQNEYSRFLPKLINYIEPFNINAPSLKIFHEHSLFEHIGRGPRVAFPIFEKNMFNPCDTFNVTYQDLVIVCSEWAKTIVEPINKNVVVSPLGVDKDFFPVAPKATGDKIIFYTQGKREVRKGHNYLHEVFHKAFQDKDDVELWMFTHNYFDKPEETMGFQQMYKSMLGDKVKFFPRLEKTEMINWIQKTDCGVFLSRAEGWCFHKDTEIITNNGLKKIKDVIPGDLIINHIGNTESVEKVLVKENKEKLLNIKVVGSQPVKITKNHPIFCFQNPYKCRVTFCKHMKNMKPKFIEAKNLKIGDFLVLPKLITKQDNSIFIENTQFNLNEDIMRFFGYYIAEGSGGNGSTTLSFHKNEKDYHEDVINILNNNFGCRPKIINYDRNRTNIVFSNVWLTDLLHKLFGRRAPNKKIPFEFLFLDNSLIKELLIGLFRGDGSHRSNSKFKLSTTSKLLANQVRLLLIKLHMRPTLQYNFKKGFLDECIVSIAGDDRYKLNFDNINILDLKKNQATINLDKFMLTPIRSITECDQENFVYNLQVSGENTYCTTSFAVHNCMPILEGMAMGKDILATYYSGQTEFLPKSCGIIPLEFEEANDGKWFNGGFTWAKIEANEEEIIARLREIYYNKRSVRVNNEENIEAAKNFTWEKTAKIIEEAINEL